MFVHDATDRRRFADRRAAGKELAQALRAYAGQDPIVLGLARGGVPIADEIARALGGSLDVWVVRKLGAPQRPELGVGAIAEGPAIVIDHDLVRRLGISTHELLEIAHREMKAVLRRVQRYRLGRDLPEIRGRVAILVDDGIATGGTMRAAIKAVKKLGPSRLVVATPVAAPEAVAMLRREADEVACLYQPDQFHAVALWYDDFRQLGDAEVARILSGAS